MLRLLLSRVLKLLGLLRYSRRCWRAASKQLNELNENNDRSKKFEIEFQIFDLASKPIFILCGCSILVSILLLPIFLLTWWLWSWMISFLLNMRWIRGAISFFELGLIFFPSARCAGVFTWWNISRYLSLTWFFTNLIFLDISIWSCSFFNLF